MRIVSTLPSATEIVCALGLSDQLVGVSHECDYPPSVRSKPIVVRSVFDASKLSPIEVDTLVRDYSRSGKSIYSGHTCSLTLKARLGYHPGRV
jgi:iron complex transport system substrate-binding protein